MFDWMCVCRGIFTKTVQNDQPIREIGYHRKTACVLLYPPGETQCCGASTIKVLGNYSIEAACSILVEKAKTFLFFTTPYGMHRGVLADPEHKDPHTYPKYLSYSNVLKKACEKLNKLSKGKITFTFVEIDAQGSAVAIESTAGDVLDFSLAINDLRKELQK